MDEKGRASLARRLSRSFGDAIADRGGKGGGDLCVVSNEPGRFRCRGCNVAAYSSKENSSIDWYMAHCKACRYLPLRTKSVLASYAPADARKVFQLQAKEFLRLRHFELAKERSLAALSLSSETEDSGQSRALMLSDLLVICRSIAKLSTDNDELRVYLRRTCALAKENPYPTEVANVATCAIIAEMLLAAGSMREAAEYYEEYEQRTGELHGRDSLAMSDAFNLRRSWD